MNITENLTRIKQGKDDIITALQNKGSDIKNDTLINEISNYVDKLEIGGGGDTPSVPTELVQKYEGATVFRIAVPEDNYEFAINLCNNASTATYDVDWGDGVLEYGKTTDEQHHTYSKAGTYDVNVYNISKGITLGGSYQITLGFNSNEKITIYYLFDNTNNDYWGVYRYIVNKDYICTDILIGKGVTYIGSSAFNNCPSLQSIVISNSVKSIEDYAFQDCSSLQSVVIPEGITSIGSNTFQSCSSLQSIVIPDGVTSIGSSAFYGCTSLQSIVIPDGVTSIGSSAFQNCYSLQSVVIPEGITSIGNYIFQSCSSLQSIVIPDGVTSIGSSAFYGCTSLQAITINSLTAQTIQSTSFPTSNFKYTKRYLYVPKESTGYDSGNFKTYLIDKGWELRYLEDREKTPTTLKLKTTNNFFHNLLSLGQANLIDYELINDEYIYNFDNKITELTQYIFYHPVLEEIIIPEGVTSIGRYAFHQCNRLQSVTIPDSVTSIEERAFYNCSILTTVSIPEGVTSIGVSVFTNCYNLQSVVIPNSLTSIETSVFQACYALQSITCKAMVAPTITSYTFSYIGQNVPTDTPKVLRVPEGAEGYDSGNWKTYVIDKGYTLEYVPLSEL